VSVVEVNGDEDRLSLGVTSPACPGGCPGWPGAPAAWPQQWPQGHPWRSRCGTKGGGTGQRSPTPAWAGRGAARTATPPAPRPVSVPVSWHAVSTCSAGSGPPAGSAGSGEHGAGPANCSGTDIGGRRPMVTHSGGTGTAAVWVI